MSMCKTANGFSGLLSAYHLKGVAGRRAAASRIERVTFEFLSLNIPVRSFVHRMLRSAKKKRKSKKGRKRVRDVDSVATR